MLAAVLWEYGATPEVGEFPEPGGEVLVDVLAAGLNPIDLRIASGTLAARRPELPCVVGSEGVGRAADGRRVYFGASSGSLAERATVPEVEAVAVPDGVGDAEAIAYGIAGLAAWLALDKAQLVAGERVLVLGASGTVGRIAVQLARLRGAGRVVAAVRRPVDGLGADATVTDLGFDDEQFDVVIDPLWGAPAVAAVAAMAFRGRLVQLGQSAGGEALLPSADVRFKELSIIGHTNFAAAPEVRADALRRMWAHAAAGELDVECETVPLADAAAAWERQAAGPGRKLVVAP
ncbi:MAG: zinc-binding alcohol dehydrogenase family protein [Solirubrobacteraceae bacterium]